MSITVNIDEFDDDEVIEYAKNTLNMMTGKEALGDFDEYELVEKLEGRGYIIIDKNYYPYNDIITADLLQRVNDNIGKIDNKELEWFLNERGI